MTERVEGCVCEQRRLAKGNKGVCTACADRIVAKVNLNAIGKLDAGSKRALEEKALRHHYLSRRARDVTNIPATESSEKNKRKLNLDEQVPASRCCSSRCNE